MKAFEVPVEANTEIFRKILLPAHHCTKNLSAVARLVAVIGHMVVVKAAGVWATGARTA